MALYDIQQPLASSFESITVSNVAIGLTASKYNVTSSGVNARTKVANEALLTVEGDQIRWTCDGTAPTGAAGHRANVDDVIRLVGYDAIRLFKAIRITTDATLRVTYFGG